MESLWGKYVGQKRICPDFSNNIKTSVLIIGGGMAGITTAYLLKIKGVDSVTVEANKVGAGITSYTTAKITSQHGLIYHDLINKIGEEGASKYLSANEDA